MCQSQSSSLSFPPTPANKLMVIDVLALLDSGTLENPTTNIVKPTDIKRTGFSTLGDQ